MIKSFNKFEYIYITEKKCNKILEYIQKKYNKKELKNILSNLKIGIKNQKKDYIKLKNIIIEYNKTKNITKNDAKFVKNIIIDIFKISTLSTIFLLPFGSIWVIALIKLLNKFNINIIPKNFKLNDNYHFDDIIQQILKSKYKQISNMLWEELLDEGFPEEVNDFKSTNYKYIILDIPEKDKQGLINFDDDILNKYNDLDIYIKDNNLYPTYLDFIDYNTGNIYIIKHEKNQ